MQSTLYAHPQRYFYKSLLVHLVTSFALCVCTPHNCFFIFHAFQFIAMNCDNWVVFGPEGNSIERPTI